MKTINKLILPLVGAVALASQVYAHHSTKGVYHEDVELHLTGTVKEWVFINPHPFMTLTVTGEDGVAHDWDVSYGGAAVIHLSRMGYTKDTFKPGDVINVIGHPAIKEGVYGLLMEGGGNIPTREDGSKVVEGGSMF
jgi:hypothetical protein